jgi:type VI secretion system protein ImpK
MNSKDPFADHPSDDRTILRPSPGGRPEEFQSLSEKTQNTISGISLLRLGHLNPLEKAASGLLALLTRINVTHSHSNPGNLKDQLTKEINLFHKNAHANNIDPDNIKISSYVLCTVLDEAALNTPWGNNCGWSKTSLLSSFHNEVSGGERFFQFLSSLGQNPAKNLHLLELMYLCLALGFEGSYRIVDGGKDSLIRIKEWLYQIICKERADQETGLSPHWQGILDNRNSFSRNIPLWVVSTLALALLAIVFTYLLFHLNSLSDPVFKKLYTIKSIPPEISIEPDPVAYPIPKITLATLLAPEISQGKLLVDVQIKREKVTILGDGLFDSGQTQIKEDFIPALHRIAESLNILPGQVLITGHSDNQPIRSTRFPSNWHLSKARAEAVSDILRQNINQFSRILVEGKADLEPVSTNKTSKGRAKNRRVEIILVKPL